MSQKNNHIRVVGFHPRAEARGALGSVSIVLSYYVTVYTSFNRLVPCSTNPLFFYAYVSALASIPASVSLSSVLPTPGSRSLPLCSHHHRFFLAPVRRPAAIHNSSIGQVAIYWVVLFWRRSTYVSTFCNTTATIAVSRGGYYHLTTVSYFF